METQEQTWKRHRPEDSGLSPEELQAKRKEVLAKLDLFHFWYEQKRALLREAFEVGFKTCTIAGAMGISESAVAYQKRQMGYGINPPKEKTR